MAERRGNSRMRRLVLACALLASSACFEAFGPGRVELWLYVDSQKVSCYTWVETECLRVRENSSESWQNFSNEIEGFAWEAGYLYRIRVERTTIANPPADGSSARYRLLQILSKTAVAE